MSTFALLQAALLGMAAYVAGHHLLIALRDRESRIHRSFGLLAVLIVLHQWVVVLRLDPMSVAEQQRIDWWNWLFELGLFAAFAAFVADFTGRGRWWRPSVYVLITGLVIVHLVSDYGFAVRSWLIDDSAHHTWHFTRGDLYWELSVWYHVFALALMATLAWSLVSSIAQARSTGRLRDRALVAALCLVAAAVINGVGKDLGFWATPALIDYSFIALVLVMSLVLSEEVVSAARLTAEVVDRERHLSITLDSIGDAVFVCNQQGVIQRMNPSAARLCGWEQDDATGMRLHELMYLRRAEDNRLIAIPDLIGRDDVTQSGDLLLTDRQQEQHRVIAGGRPIRTDKGQDLGLVLVMRDVSERYELERQVRHMQKMEAIGQLAGGVAHDFNNVLSGVLGFAELALECCGAEQDEREKREKARHYLDHIIQLAERASGITRQLLSFSRKQEPERISLDVHAVIQEVRAVLERTVGEGIAITCELGSHHANIVGDLSQIHSVLLNLGVNARDAMPGGGHLTFSTRTVALDEAACRSLPERLAEGEYIQISVRDDGCGMEPEVTARIFEPFFTTKEVGKGTGLGLAMVYGTVHEHGGVVTVHSVPGEGTVFDVFLPLSGAPGSISTGANIALPRRTMRVLVADDEEPCRDIVRFVLEDLGHTVDTAADGFEAIELWRRERYDLVITDMVMPRLGGAEVHAAVRADAPGLPILIASGFASSDQLKLLLQDARTLFIQKPFRRKDLLRAVSKVQATEF